jgi:hypothetical protein
MKTTLPAAVLLCALPNFALAWVNPNDPPMDVVLPVEYTQAQIAFERAPQALVNACRDSKRPRFLIFAETARPEGVYMYISGPFLEDNDESHGPVLEYDDRGDIVLIKKSGACDPLWVPDNAFNNYDPFARSDKPTSEEADIVHDLGVSLIQRAERAFGGRGKLLKAIDASGRKDSDDDSAMIPLIERLRKLTQTRGRAPDYP